MGSKMTLLDLITQYGRKYRVYETTDDQGNPKRLLRLGSGNTVESVWGFGDTGLYWDDIADAVPKTAKEILMIGVGGGTIARLLRERNYQGKIIGIEYDPIIIQIGKRWFETDTFLDTIVLDDGIEWIKNCPVTFDCIILDAYENGGKTSIHNEIYTEALNKLSKDGVLITNQYEKGENTIILERNICI